MSSFPTDTFTGVSGDLDVYISEVWGSKINDFAKEALQLASFFTDRSSELAEGGDTVHTPLMTEMSSATKTIATAVTLNSPTETAKNLVVNTWNEVSFAIEDREAVLVKKSYYIQERYAKNAGYTAGATLETAIAVLFGTFTDSVGASTTVMLDSDIRKAIGIAEANTKETADNGNFVFIIDTKVFWNQVAGITTFQLNTNSPAVDPVTKRPMPMLYGVPVKLSNRVPYVSSTTGRYNVLAHKDSIHYACSKLPNQTGSHVRVQSNYIPDYLSTVTTADILFGVLLNRATYGVNILTSAA
jgi:hypothetical protein